MLEGKCLELHIYYISKMLHNAEMRYTLVTASRQLRYYFQAYHVTVLTPHPLSAALVLPNISGADDEITIFSSYILFLNPGWQ